jgi:DnaJ-class molecular chaperone
LLTAFEIYCAAEAKINGDLDLYAILQAEATAYDMVIRKQYEKLAVFLHGDNNILPCDENTFKLISEAHATLCDQMERSLYQHQKTMLPEK